MKHVQMVFTEDDGTRYTFEGDTAEVEIGNHDIAFRHGRSDWDGPVQVRIDAVVTASKLAPGVLLPGEQRIRSLEADNAELRRQLAERQ